MAYNISAMVTNTVNILRDNLHDRYDSGFPILKELIQNANDAGASELSISKFSGSDESEHPLLKREALLVFNNGKVSDDDLLGLVSVAKGGKTGKEGVIGKFGLGMKSIFHFCDMFFYAAFQDGNIQIKMVNPFIDPRTGNDPFHPEWNSFSDNDNKIIEKEALKLLNSNKDGLLLWLPLRQLEDHHKVINDIYTINTIWKQNDVLLKKNIALSLVALDISTPCNKGKRTLKNIKIKTQEPKVSVNFPLESNIIYADDEEYCSLIKSELLISEKGEEKLENIIEKNKFTKISYVDSEGEEKEVLEYKKEQSTIMAIVRFYNSDEKSIHFDWCSYLPLNSSADTVNFFEDLDSEYHILIHANFAIDSGRKSIVDFNDCISKKFQLDIDSVEDDRSSQRAWNCILIRNYILPNLLKFVCNSGFEESFIKSLYETICKANSSIGYYCLSAGFAYKLREDDEKTKWAFSSSIDINETAISFLKSANNYSMNYQTFNDDIFYSVVLNVVKYIQLNVEGVDWAVVNATKNITNENIVEISKIAFENDIPIFFIPFARKVQTIDFFKIKDVNIIKKFLLSFENDNLKKLVGFVYEALCSDKCINKELCAEIYANEDIKQFVPLFPLGRVNIQSTKYLVEYKTYDEVYEISKDLRLFSNYGVDNKNTNLHKYGRIFKNIELYIITEITAKQQFFLTDRGASELYRFEDSNNTEDAIKVLNYMNLNAILSSMEKHSNLISHEDIHSCSDFIYEIRNLPKNDIIRHQAIIRNILVGNPVSNNREIYSQIESGDKLTKSNFYKNLLEKYTDSYVNNHFINSDIEINSHLNESLNIVEITGAKLEKLIEEESYNILQCTPEEKITLAKYLEDESIFRKLKIHETKQGTFVSLLDNKCFLENEKVDFPVGYELPQNIKIIKRNPEILLQNVIPVLEPVDIINTILCDETISLDIPSGIKISGEIKNLLETYDIHNEDIYPVSRNKRWIQGDNFNYYSLNEVINNSFITDNVINKCDGLISYDCLRDEYKSLKRYFLSDNDTVLKEIVKHHKTDGENKWPWFNINEYDSLKSLDDKNTIFLFLEKTEDPIINILKIFKNNTDILSYLLSTDSKIPYINDKMYIQTKKIDYILRICSSYTENSPVLDFVKKHLVELFKNNESNFGVNLLQRIQANTDNVLLPNQSGKWKNVRELVNFNIEIPDLSIDNTLDNEFKNYFPKQEARAGESNGSEVISFDKFLNEVCKCKSKKLWGVFAFIISKIEEKSILYNHSDMFEKTEDEVLKTMRLPEIQSSKIVLHSTKGNYCVSLTGGRVELNDAADVDSLFYNEPTYDNGNLQIDLFDNFMLFSADSIERAIRQLFFIYNIHNVPERFFLNLANPEQVPIAKATNIIFSNIFNTLKVLKLDLRAGQYNEISNKWEEYQDACGEENTSKMMECKRAVQHSIQNNNGNIQEKIRQKVISFIENAEYKERCILFELFQNADDAYSQLNLKNNSECYFNILYNENRVTLEHIGRPINQYRVGSNKEYKSDLINMLNIGWSNKSELEESQRQTGKFGYGFKTVYLICDEPQIISGDYNFLIKAALYPEVVKNENEYSEETKIILNLNSNGKAKEKEIIEEFEHIVEYQLLFSKKINKIKFNNATYTWTPNITAELTNYIVLEDKKFIVFKTKPIMHGDPHNEQACIAFKKEKNNIVPFDSDAPKIWCMAPLLGFSNIGFAISANFKTNTGRQTLALENNENKNTINKISIQFAEALLELWNKGICKDILPQIINTVFIGTTKTVFEPIPKRILDKFLSIGYIPDGVNKLYNLERKELYSLSASYFNDKIEKQFSTIQTINNFIEKNTSMNMLVITEIVAIKLKDVGIEVKNLKKVINILDIIIEGNRNINNQIKILVEFNNNSSLINIIKNKDEHLSNCHIYDAFGNLKHITDVLDVSKDYGESKEILEQLFVPTRKAYDNNIERLSSGQNYSNYEDIDDDSIYDGSFEDVYEFWKNKISEDSWKTLVSKYYGNFYPDNLTSSMSNSKLNIDNDKLYELYSDDKMPENWCTLILLAICQSITAWNHTDATNRNAINWLYDNELINKFCFGENLQTLYDLYLSKSGNNELYLRHFECLLRIYKIRKNFVKFYTLLSQFPNKKNINSIREFLDVSSDEELTGKGIELDSNIRSLNFGIHTIIRELLLNNFWSNEDNLDVLKKFAYMPRKSTIRLFDNLTEYAKSEDIYDSINIKLGDRDIRFLDWFDLPFLIYREEEND